MKSITSPENPLIKSITRIQHRTGHRAKGRFLLEGEKLAREALASGTKIESAVVSKRFHQSSSGRSILSHLDRAGVDCAEVSERLFRRLSNLESPEGVLLIARKSSQPLADLSCEWILVVAGSRDPGNVGTMARIAEAAGTEALVRCRGSVNPFQAKALRASMGSLLRIPVYEAGTPEETLPVLKAKGFAVAACLAHGGTDYRKTDLRGRLALVVGDESTGLSDHVLELSDMSVSIPMRESVESLNVAFAAGLLLYEAARQRGCL
jgi:TrmH family RNA methyltransferase